MSYQETDWWVDNGWIVALGVGLGFAALLNLVAYILRRRRRARAAERERDQAGS